MKTLYSILLEEGKDYPRKDLLINTDSKKKREWIKEKAEEIREAYKEIKKRAKEEEPRKTFKDVPTVVLESLDKEEIKGKVRYPELLIAIMEELKEAYNHKLSFNEVEDIIEEHDLDIKRKSACIYLRKYQDEIKEKVGVRPSAKIEIEGKHIKLVDQGAGIVK